MYKEGVYWQILKERERQGCYFQAASDLPCVWCFSARITGCFTNVKWSDSHQSFEHPREMKNTVEWFEMNANCLPPMPTHPPDGTVSDGGNPSLWASGMLMGAPELPPKEPRPFTLCQMLFIQEGLANSQTDIPLTNLCIFWERSPATSLGNPVQIEICDLFSIKSPFILCTHMHIYVNLHIYKLFFRRQKEKSLTTQGEKWLKARRSPELLGEQKWGHVGRGGRGKAGTDSLNTPIVRRACVPNLTTARGPEGTAGAARLDGSLYRRVPPADKDTS